MGSRLRLNYFKTAKFQHAQWAFKRFKRENGWVPSEDRRGRQAVSWRTQAVCEHTERAALLGAQKLTGAGRDQSTLKVSWLRFHLAHGDSLWTYESDVCKLIDIKSLKLFYRHSLAFL
jgi:hypothetical protein